MVSRGIEEPHSWLTLKEAAVLASVSEKKIRHELANRVLTSHSKRRSHAFRPREVLFLKVVSGLPFDLRPSDRRDLYDVLTKRKHSRGIWIRTPDGLLLKGAVEADFKIGGLRRELVEHLRILRRGSRRVEAREDVLGGEPVFAGTRIPIRHVGQLVRKGVPLSELREDYPNLQDDDFAFAPLFLDLGKPPGRPKKRALRLRRLG